MMFFGVIVFFMFTTHSYAEDKPKNSLDCFNDADCLEDMQENKEQPIDISEDESIVPADDTNSLGFNIVKMILMLLVILGLIYVLIKFLKKRHHLFNNVKTMENLDGISVGQNKSLQIVRIGSNFYIIGVGDDVNMLEEITDETLIEDLLHKQTESGQSGNILSRFLSKKKKDEEASSPFATLFSNELENMKKNRQTAQKGQKKEDDRYE